MDLRPFQPVDLETLYAIDHACFPPGISYSREELAQYIAGPDSETWIAWDDGKIVGFLIAELDAETGGHIITIDVVKEWRRRGIATALMSAAEDWARGKGAPQVFLETAEDNLAAQRFYQALGYIKVDRIAGYYSNGMAAWVMVKRLGDRSEIRTPRF